MGKFNSNSFNTEIKSHKIDVFISSSSFEDRCFVIPNILSKNSFKELLFFYNNNEVKEIIENAEKLVKNDSKSTSIELNSNDPILNHNVFAKHINEITQKYKKPNVLIDTTTFTHESLLVLIKLIELKKEQFGQIFCAYVGAKEYSTNITDNEEKWLSKGIMDIRNILGYPGYSDPTKKNHLMILFGFEFDRTRLLIEAFEYDYITIGFASVDASIQSNHQKINAERHCKLVKEFLNTYDFSFSLIDPYQTKNQILEYLRKDIFINLNTVIAPLNNKISTIGAGLAAMENTNIQLTYAKPVMYNTYGYSSPNDDIYLFELTF